MRENGTPLDKQTEENMLRLQKEAEKEMNKLASEGWRVIAVSPNVGMGYGVVVTYERKKD